MTETITITILCLGAFLSGVMIGSLIETDKPDVLSPPPLSPTNLPYDISLRSDGQKILKDMTPEVGVVKRPTIEDLERLKQSPLERETEQVMEDTFDELLNRK